MPRFFFHSQDGADVADQVGTELASVAAAKAEATRRAIVLFKTRDDDAWYTRDWTQTVMDERGTVILRLDLKRAERPRS